MNNLKIFKNEEFGNLRAVEIDGVPWFAGKDVATALGYLNASDALGKHVDREDKDVIANRDNAGRKNKPAVIINESGLYSLILSSKLPTAKKFKHWVTSEVLPAIRKRGVYMTDEKAYDITHDKTSLIDLLQQAADQLKEKDVVIERRHYRRNQQRISSGISSDAN